MALGLTERLGFRTATSYDDWVTALPPSRDNAPAPLPEPAPTSTTADGAWQAGVPNAHYHEIRVMASADPDFQRSVFHGFDPTGDPISVDYGAWQGANRTGVYAERWQRPDTQARPVEDAMERDLAEDAHQMRAAIDFYSWTGIPFAGGYWSISQDRP